MASRAWSTFLPLQPDYSNKERTVLKIDTTLSPHPHLLSNKGTTIPFSSHVALDTVAQVLEQRAA